MDVGQVVRVQGLQSRAELNGRLAVILEVGERWRCQAVASDEIIRLKPENTIGLDEASGQTRCRLRAADFPSLQAAVDAAAEKSAAVVEVERDYNEVIRITKPVSVIGGIRPGSPETTGVKLRWCVAGVEVDLQNSSMDLAEIRNLQLGSAAAWMRGSGVRIFDGSPVVASCTIGGMFAIRVDSFKCRSCPVLVGNLLESRLGGIWWDGACWDTLPERKGPGAPPLSPAIVLEAGGMPKFVLETVALNQFSNDLRWVCCIDSGVLALLTGDHVMPLEVPGPEDQQRQAIAAEIKACPWFVHRPTLALMDRPEKMNERAAWALLAEEAENDVRLEVQARKMFSEADQIRHWRDNGDLLPEDAANMALGSALAAASLEDQESPNIFEVEEPVEAELTKESEGPKPLEGSKAVEESTAVRDSDTRDPQVTATIEDPALQWQRMRDLEETLSEGYPQ